VANRRFFTVAVLTIGILLFGCSPAKTSTTPPALETPGAAEAMDSQTETYNLVGAAQIELKNIRGTINLKTGAPGQITISAVKVGQGKNANEARGRLAPMTVSFEDNGNTISVIADPGGGSSKSAWTGKQVELSIVAQEDTALKLTDGAGLVKLAGITGGVDIAGGAITVNLSNIRGGVSIAVQGGSVQLDGIGGDSKVSSQGAPISITRLSSSSLSVTSDTNISIRDTQVDGDTTVKSVSGKLSLLRLKTGAISADAGKGSLEMAETTADHGITVQATDGRVYVNRVNSELLKVTTTGGEMDVSEVQGGVELATVNGQIALSKASPSSVTVKGGAGDVTVEGQLPQPGETSVTTKSGHISVTVPRETSFALEAITKMGKVTVDPRFGLTGSGGSKGQVNGIVGGGLLHLALTSDSGNITIQTGQR